jgi:A/G-specific adenine glycosylase
MLQQTQVASVVDYYLRFLARFPNVHQLASASERDVLGMWAGLGYYRRARQLHAAAQQIVERFDGQFPKSVYELNQLPGIGRYTAGAIASIAFDVPAPILEANTQRLFARLMCLRDSLQSPAAQERLWQFAQWQLPRQNRPGSRTLNQAAMELGSLVCKPLEPLCPKCPLLKLCPAASQNLQRLVPAAKPKKTITQLRHIALAVTEADRWLVRINPPGAWWTGLWDFPRLDVSAYEWSSDRSSSAFTSDRANLEKIEQAAQSQLDLKISIGEKLFTITHSVTRYRIRLDCFSATGCRMPRSSTDRAWQWATLDELLDLPLTAPAKKIRQHLNETPKR